MTDRKKIILITGGTAGIGREAAQQLARDGHVVWVHGRKAEQGERAVRELREATGNGAVKLLLADLSSLASVREGIERFRRETDRLDVLINNAAMSQWGMEARRESADGFELLFATNYLSHYLITRLLLDRLITSRGRVVTVGARQMGATIDFDDLQMQRGWTGMRAILQAKLGLFCMTRELSRRLKDSGATANILDPGLAMTGYQAKAGWFFKLILKMIGQPPEKIAETYAWLATSDEVSGISGRLFSGRKQVPFKGQAADDEVAARLWIESAKLVDLPEDTPGTSDRKH